MTEVDRDDGRQGDGWTGGSRLIDRCPALAVDHGQQIGSCRKRDVAVVVKESVTHDQLMGSLRNAPVADLVRSATLFDIYRPKPGADAAGGANLGIDEKSLAVRLVLDGGQETLTDERIETAVQSVLAQWQADVGARLRG